MFGFLTCFVKEAGMSCMSKASALIALYTSLADRDKTQYRINLSGGSQQMGITCWPEAVQYLLYSYADATTMREVPDGFRKIRRNEDEAEELYRKQVTRTSSDAEMITIRIRKSTLLLMDSPIR